jgi:hypothetical protein
MMKTFRIVFGLMLLSAICSNPAFMLIPGSQPAYAQSSPEPSAKPKITFKGGPGDTPETAVVIVGATNSMTGISAEYYYLEKQFGRRNVDWNLRRQSVLNQKGKVYDRMDLDLKDGSKRTVFFDISEFFGKL